MRLVMVEGLLIGVMSWLFGVILAFPISSLMANAINLALFGAPAEFTFTPSGGLPVVGGRIITFGAGECWSCAQCDAFDHPRSTGL